MRILPPSDEDKVSLLLKPEDPKYIVARSRTRFFVTRILFYIRNLFGELHFEKHLRCSARMTVAHLKKFLAAKSNWKLENIQQVVHKSYIDQLIKPLNKNKRARASQIDIFCKGQPLRDELTLEFIWRIRWGNTVRADFYYSAWNLCLDKRAARIVKANFQNINNN